MKKLPFLLLAAVSIVALFFPGLPGSIVTEGIVGADVAWVLMSTALVMFMTPGLALFYGGMVNAKNIISTMLQSFIAMGVVSILWVVVGFGIAFGHDVNGLGLFGNPFEFLMFNGVLEAKPWSLAPTIPLALFALFQMKFAIITPALITGSFSERIKFTSYVVFIGLFSIFIYSPLAHWAWHPDGWLFKLGVLDFAGGTVVHISAGCAALAAALYLGKKKEGEETKPANIPFVLIGTGILWFGWFGFNAGSALGSGALAVSAFATTNTAAAAAGLAWVFFDSAVRNKKPTALGFSIGAVVGLVAITPAAGYVGIPASIFIGTCASVISNLIVGWRAKSRLDDTLDVFPCHGVGGMTGMLLTAVFASSLVNPALAGVNGLANGGGFALLQSHLIALLAVAAFAFFGSLVLLKITDMISPLRVSDEERRIGLDITQHNEEI